MMFSSIHPSPRVALSWFWMLAVLASLVLAPEHSYAQAITPEPSDVCTDGPQFRTEIPDGTEGIIGKIAGDITTLMNTLSEDLFNSIINDDEYQYALAAILTLYVGIYGMLFALGMTQTNAYDFSMRIVRVGIFAILMSPNAWDFFNDTVVAFFNELVNAGLAGSVAPTVLMDQALTTIISANMVVHLLAMIFTSTFGFLYALMLGFAIWSFLSALLTAIWVFLTAIVLRALLFGVAPVFLACFLFDRTRHYTLSWLNQILNTVLQPMLLFLFFSFFEGMIMNTVDSIMNYPVCWTEAHDMVRGTPFAIPFWRYTVPSGTSNTGWEPYGGLWDVPPVNLDFMAILVFLVLAEISKRFNHVVLMIARDISASSTDLSLMRGAFVDLLPTGRVDGAAKGSGAKSSTLGTQYRQLVEGARKDGIVETFKKNFGDTLQ